MKIYSNITVQCKKKKERNDIGLNAISSGKEHLCCHRMNALSCNCQNGKVARTFTCLGLIVIILYLKVPEVSFLLKLYFRESGRCLNISNQYTIPSEKKMQIYIS